MELKKNQEILLTIEDFTREGEGLGKYQGFPLFVKDTVIGDKAKVSVTKLKKNYGYARLVEILEPSPDRVTPPCPVARQCGGCKIQQLSYEKQKEFKWNQVANCLKRIGGFDGIEAKMEPIYGMEHPWRYRNKAQYPIGLDKDGSIIAGFYVGRTHTIVPNTDCLIRRRSTKTSWRSSCVICAKTTSALMTRRATPVWSVTCSPGWDLSPARSWSVSS